MEAKTIARKACSISKKKRSFEIVEVPLVLKLPRPYMEFMEELARVLDTSLEAILKEEIYSTLRDFCTSGSLEGWIDSLFQDYVNGEKGKQLEAMVQEIMDS